MSAFAFDPVVLPATAVALRAEVRAFLRDELVHTIPAERRANSWSVFDAAFTRKLARRGWIGMTWRQRHGVPEPDPAEGLGLVEEQPDAGGQVGAHRDSPRQDSP